MIDSPSLLRDADAVAPPQASFCENGTVGWEDGSWYELASDSDDGPLLLHVTLYAGKSPSTAAKPGIAQGYPILCRVNTMFGHRIPAKGTACVVMAPGGDWETHGNPVVVALIEKNPQSQIDPKRVVTYYGDDVHILFKGKSVAMQDTPASGSSVFVAVGTPFAGGVRGFYAVDETGSGFSTASGFAGAFSSDAGVAKSLLQLTPVSANLLCNNPSTSGLHIEDGDVKAIGLGFYTITAGTYLGPGATPATPARYGTPPVPLISATVFMSP